MDIPGNFNRTQINRQSSSSEPLTTNFQRQSDTAARRPTALAAQNSVMPSNLFSSIYTSTQIYIEPASLMMMASNDSAQSATRTALNERICNSLSEWSIDHIIQASVNAKLEMNTQFIASKQLIKIIHNAHTDSQSIETIFKLSTIKSMLPLVRYLANKKLLSIMHKIPSGQTLELMDRYNYMHLAEQTRTGLLNHLARLNQKFQEPETTQIKPNSNVDAMSVDSIETIDSMSNIQYGLPTDLPSQIFLEDKHQF